MTFAELTARWQAGLGMTTDLGKGPIPVTEWKFSPAGGIGYAVAGPYADVLDATGMTLAAGGAEERRQFKSRLTIPPGATVRVTVTLGMKGPA